MGVQLEISFLKFKIVPNIYTCFVSFNNNEKFYTYFLLDVDHAGQLSAVPTAGRWVLGQADDSQVRYR